MTWTVTEKARNIHCVDVRMDDRDSEAHFLLVGDQHFDNPASDHDLQRKHLDEARKIGAGVISVGDFFCAMEGRADPRRSRAGCRPEHQAATDYFDSLVRHAADFLSPYADLMVVLGRGNHEQSVLKNQETDLIDRLCERISEKSGRKVHSGGYGGWVLFTLHCGSKRCRVAMKYFHGSGGGGLMTFDTLRVRRIAGWVPDADIVVGGHTHDQWWNTVARERIRTIGSDYRVELDVQHHVRCGTYKDEYGDGHSGWHVERGGAPKPLGAVWMRITAGSRDTSRFRPVVDFRRAS